MTVPPYPGDFGRQRRRPRRGRGPFVARDQWNAWATTSTSFSDAGNICAHVAEERRYSRRLDTLSAAERLDPVPVDNRVAAAWALLRQRLKAAGKRMEINDSWIAATAIAHGWPVVTQDDGFPTTIPGLVVIGV
ncbi:MAG: PIN domain-containing protein [Nitriliruptorales bacterium]|nr:PIN domain-containing protein [Nitriliruptorales bacterium]